MVNREEEANFNIIQDIQEPKSGVETNPIVKREPEVIERQIIEEVQSIQINLVKSELTLDVNHLANKENSNDDQNSITQTNNITNKKHKTKKLLNTHVFLDEDDSLPGTTQNSPIVKSLKSTKTKGTPALFKPKSHLENTGPSTIKKGKKKADHNHTPIIQTGVDSINRDRSVKNHISLAAVSDSPRTTLSQKLKNLATDNVFFENDFFKDKGKKERINERNNNLVDKTNTLSKKLFKDPNKLRKSLSTSLAKEKKYFFAHLNLKSNKLNKMKEAIDELNNSNESRSEIITTHQKQFNSNTTHLIVDFEQIFDTGDVDLKAKLIILLAVLNNCKIVRYEWLNHSIKKMYWLNEEKYCLENYIEDDINEYSDSDFDVKVVKMIRHLKLSKINLFSQNMEIFLIKERQESNKSNIEFDDLTLFDKKSTLQVYLSQIIQKCGGVVSGKVRDAELMVALDKTNDYDDDNQTHQNKIKLDQNYFVTCIKKMKKMIKREEVDVLSSEWILDCILENKILDKQDYRLVRLRPE